MFSLLVYLSFWQCAMNITDHVFALVSHDDDLITESEFEDATMTLFYLFSLNNIQSTCNMSLWLTSLENYQTALLKTDGTENVLTEEELDIILEQMNQNYSPETLSKVRMKHYSKRLISR